LHGVRVISIEFPAAAAAASLTKDDLIVEIDLFFLFIARLLLFLFLGACCFFSELKSRLDMKHRSYCMAASRHVRY
jgi:hypothetical protein